MMENFSKFELRQKLNKGISAPIGILVVVLCFGVAVAGIFVYYNLADEELEELQESKELPYMGNGAQNEVQENDSEIITFNWKIYKSENFGVEFEIPPLFEENGYEIIEDKSTSIIFDKKCNTIFFDTKPTPPLWSDVDKNKLHTMFVFQICPLEYCDIESNKDICEALLKGNHELPGGDVIFADYLADNKKYIAYSASGPSTGDAAEAMGWGNPNTKKLMDQMLSTFRLTDAGTQNEVQENDSEISIEELENAEYYISESIGKVKLQDGKYFKRWQQDSATGLSIWIEKEQIAFGDLDNDGKDDAAVILYISGGAGSIDTELAVMLNKQGKPMYHTSLPLGCKEIIHSAGIELDLTGSNIIVVDITTHGPDDSVRKVVRYKLFKKELVEIEDEKTYEKSYSDKDAKFTLNYPSYVSLDAKDSDFVLQIFKKKIDLLDAGPLGYNKETAIKDRQALSKGQYGELIDWPLEESKKVIKLGNGEYGKSFMALGRYEVCDVVFERILIFYSEDYLVRIRLSYTGIDEIRNSMPEYFKTDEENCGTAMIWKDKQGFYRSLANNNGSYIAQKWYDTFDDIVKSIDN